MEPLLLVQGSLTESDLLSVARYTAWNRSTGMKIMLSLACLMMLAGIGAIVTGQAGNAVVPLLAGRILFSLLFRLAEAVSEEADEGIGARLAGRAL